jgi:hypothetical protein
VQRRLNFSEIASSAPRARALPSIDFFFFAYPNWTDEDQEALVERELQWRDRGIERRRDEVAQNSLFWS